MASGRTWVASVPAVAPRRTQLSRLRQPSTASVQTLPQALFDRIRCTSRSWHDRGNVEDPAVVDSATAGANAQQLRLGGMQDTLPLRLDQAQAATTPQSRLTRAPEPRGHRLAAAGSSCSGCRRAARGRGRPARGSLRLREQPPPPARSHAGPHQRARGAPALGQGAAGR